MADKALVRSLVALQMGKVVRDLFPLVKSFVNKTTRKQIVSDWQDMRMSLIIDFIDFVKAHTHKSVKWCLSVFKRRVSLAVTAAQLRAWGIGLDYDKYVQQGWNTSELRRIHTLICIAKENPKCDVPAVYAARRGLKEKGLTNARFHWYSLTTARLAASTTSNGEYADGSERLSNSIWEVI